MTAQRRSRPVAIIADPLTWLGGLFVLLLLGMPRLGGLFAWAFPGVTPAVYPRQSFLALWLSHFVLVLASSSAAAVIAIALGVFVTRPAGRDFRTMLDTIATIGQTFPPVAVLAIAVPAVGFGEAPTLIALTLYGLLPIIENTMAGLDSVPPPIIEASAGMGMSPLSRLRQVELPLAAPIILAGIRTSVIINIGTATIGSTVGAVTLGTPIIDGLVSDKLPYILQGAVLAGLFAILVDLGFERLDAYLRRAAVAA